MKTFGKPSRLLALATSAAIAAALSLVPIAAASAANDARQRRTDIRIVKNSEFDAAHGVRSGSGTAEDPYVISGWELNRITIKDTSAHVTITDNAVNSQMVLDWIGNGVHVYNNTVSDLRVNQNVRRTGAPTSGTIEHNTFGVVGQLRHWDGIFQYNTVGYPSGDDIFEKIYSSARAVNFDGYNGAVFANNTIHGYMDARLHGHHHSSRFDDGSHDHSEHDMLDHTQRYHEVWVTDNKIYADSRYGLAYLDTNHAANDRTAASETNEDLNKPHVHHTRAHLTGNELVGSGISVIVFNANDERHTGTAPGLVEIADNKITLIDNDLYPYGSRHGITAETARDLELHIEDNSVKFQPRDLDPVGYEAQNDRSAGIYLIKFDVAAIHLCNNEVSDRYYGVRASQFTTSVNWMVHGLTTHGVNQSVSWDSTVKNRPEVMDGTTPCHEDEEEHEH